jgi:uncharacterized lipoprotein YajG
MKLLSLFAVVASLMLVGCQKPADSGAGTTPPSTNPPAQTK